MLTRLTFHGSRESGFGGPYLEGPYPVCTWGGWGHESCCWVLTGRERPPLIHLGEEREGGVAVGLGGGRLLGRKQGITRSKVKLLYPKRLLLVERTAT
ncbi:unnamed protein product [Boreogadus saida]